jgi:hypothetical protein
MQARDKPYRTGDCLRQHAREAEAEASRLISFLDVEGWRSSCIGMRLS